eukprot:3017305-Amphidinium_carterae.1
MHNAEGLKDFDTMIKLCCSLTSRSILGWCEPVQRSQINNRFFFRMQTTVASVQKPAAKRHHCLIGGELAYLPTLNQCSPQGAT